MLPYLKRVFDDWKPQDLDTSAIPSEEGIQFPRDDIDDLQLDRMTPISVFELFFNNQIFTYLQNQMNVCSAPKPIKAGFFNHQNKAGIWYFDRIWTFTKAWTTRLLVYGRVPRESTDFEVYETR